MDILHKANPWAGADWNRTGCLLCKSRKEEGRKEKQDCKKTNLVYDTSCQTCNERNIVKVYEGETGRSARLRGAEHLKDLEETREKGQYIEQVFQLWVFLDTSPKIMQT